MSEKKEATSVYKTMEEHEKLIHKDILPRLGKVENLQEENTNEILGIKSELQSIKTEVTAVRNAQSGLELTVLKDGAQTRDLLLNRFVDHYFTADGKAFKSKELVTLKKLSTKEKVWIAVITVLASGVITVTGNVLMAYFS